MELNMTLDSLERTLELASVRAVGKIMKRFEIIDNKDVLKETVKELLYESFRDTRDLLVSTGRGLEPTVFKFKSHNQK